MRQEQRGNAATGYKEKWKHKHERDAIQYHKKAVTILNVPSRARYITAEIAQAMTGGNLPV